jgi:hypothetical protein
MIIWDDVDPDNPLDVAAISNDVNLSQNNHDAPSITPASADTLVVHGFVAGGPPDTWTAPTGTTQRVQQSAVSGARAIMVVDKAGPAAGVASGVANAALTGFQEAIVFTLALKSATASETLRACYELGRKSHRNADSTVSLVSSRSLFPAFLSRF